jgi:hypothetical protein
MHAATNEETITRQQFMDIPSVDAHRSYFHTCRAPSPDSTRENCGRPVTAIFQRQMKCLLPSIGNRLVVESAATPVTNP